MMTLEEEKLWLQKAAAGDKAAMELLLDTYRPLIKAAAGREHLSSCREDALSAARLYFIEALRRYDPELGVPFAAFAKKIVHGGVRTFFRRELNRWQREMAPLASAADEEGEDGLDPWETIEDKRAGEEVEKVALKESLRQVIRQLSGEERRLLKLLIIEERPQREVAEILGLSQQTVSYRRGSLLRKMRDLLEG